MKKFVLLLILVHYSMEISSPQLLSQDDLDAKKTIPELVISYGYSFEEHKVVTQDGYILTMWRIPKKLGEKRSKKPPILIQHGLLDNGFSWLFKHIHRNLPIILLEAGYDVWIGNNRGTIQSLEHKNREKYNWKDVTNEYWDFSFDEMGKYDFPAMIDYIRDITGYEKVTYIGHSQGTSQFWVKAMLDPDYINSCIQTFIGYAPVLYARNVPGLIALFLNYFAIPDLFTALNIKNFWSIPFMLPVNYLIIHYFPKLMTTIVWLITGFTKGDNLNEDRMQVAASNEPGGTSTQNMLHWVQLMRKDGFRMHDFGDSEKNKEKYGQETPPDYKVENLKKLKVPILLMASPVDALISQVDLNRLFALLPKDGFQFLEVDDFGHLDYIWADSADIKVYPQSLAFLKKHANREQSDGDTQILNHYF